MSFLLIFSAVFCDFIIDLIHRSNLKLFINVDENDDSILCMHITESAVTQFHQKNNNLLHCNVHSLKLYKILY